ncbi:hypothetical protein PC129_g20378 [Phytophthora cactorum]|uniref:Uncharacterized protein n=1 Tax=Phytophthora cactorum TaxID=29920 RepID=A0A8T1EG53_9STRA|nr:hypothetical protein Pcac1_g16052 [Phytophthora cactorum]KAG3107883.1 hypothetical protein PI125_g12319 [Phytophthora idaei]KAG2803095.1 hypothetical protein PC111_g18824 [Phytophthora cactorum]KAG2830631.1 hypothetical protein PC112_g7602 [Phytophthora cactorum]KAG2858493.1 hypothetical protein PC113_g9760 [Phytophthora cactorum]
MSNGAQLAKTAQLIHTFYTMKSASERSRAASGKAAVVVMPRRSG